MFIFRNCFILSSIFAHTPREISFGFVGSVYGLNELIKAKGQVLLYFTQHTIIYKGLLPPRIDAQDRWFKVTPPTMLFSCILFGLQGITNFIFKSTSG